MKVKDLIHELNKLDQNLEVYGYTEDEDFATDKNGFFVLDIDSVNVSEVETSRDDERKPVVKFGQSNHSRKIAFINVTKVF